MISAYVLATTLFISQAVGEFATGCLNFDGLATEALKSKIMEAKAKKEYEAYLERLRVSNYFSHEDFYYTLEQSTHDLKVIQAILYRYQDDFALMRQPEYRLARAGAKQRFQIPLYDYKYDKDITYIMLFIWDGLREMDISHAQKRSEYIALIKKIKMNLIFLRDRSIKYNEKMSNILRWLWWAEFYLNEHQKTKEWGKHKAILEYLDNF